MYALCNDFSEFLANQQIPVTTIRMAGIQKTQTKNIVLDDSVISHVKPIQFIYFFKDISSPIDSPDPDSENLNFSNVNVYDILNCHISVN